MADTRAASRYAKALLDLSIEQNKLDTIHEDIKNIQSAMSSRDLQLLAKSPIINSSKKIGIFKTLFEGKVDQLTMGFLELITKKGRETKLLAITNSFTQQYKKYNKITAVKLTTATPLTDEAKKSIEKALLESNVTDKVVDMESVVDEEIIGGFVIEVGDKLYDASILHKLNKVRKEFSQNKYIKSF